MLQRKAGMALLFSDKVDFRAKKITCDREEYYIMTIGSILQEDIIIFNVYVPNSGTSNYVRQHLTEL